MARTLRGAAVGNLGQWAKARSSNIAVTEAFGGLIGAYHGGVFDWDEIVTRMRVIDLPIGPEVMRQLGKEKNEKESLGAAWARFSLLTQSDPDLSLPDHVLLQHFQYGLDKESAENLDISAGGSFAHKTTVEGRELLDLILENDSFGRSEAIPEVEIIHEEPLHVGSEPDSTAESSSQSQEPEEEQIHPTEIPFQFEEDFFEDYGNTSNYSCEKRPLTRVHSNDPLNKAMLKKTVKKLTTIMSNEWLREGELSSESIQIRCPSSTIMCLIGGNLVRALYNPSVGANIMSATFAFDCLGDRLLEPTVKTFRISTNSTIEGLGIISGVPVWHKSVQVILDFHIFDISDLEKPIEKLIGQPIEKLLDVPETGVLNLKVGRIATSVPVFQSTNSLTEPLPVPEPIEEVMAISPLEPPESIFDESIEEFNEGEDETGEPMDQPKTDLSSRAPIELKPLPSGLRYAFLNGDAESPVIISDKLSEREMTRLIAVLEKHRAAFGYSLQDLKGIRLSLCTHRIPLEPFCTPSREPQRRLNNAMREVVKKEVLKLLHAGIIYPVPYSEWVSPVQVVPKKGGMTVVENSNNELIPQRTVTGWRMCFDYRKLNKATKKDHFPLPFIDEMLERLANHSFFCFLDGYSGYHQIPIHPDDQTGTCEPPTTSLQWRVGRKRWSPRSLPPDLVEERINGLMGMKPPVSTSCSLRLYGHRRTGSGRRARCHYRY
uniref:Retrotransposon protein, putative, unclassified n=2 Tax=Oryza sativa subsp. japonica TaxID=39947 RepID=Q75LF2_ORYSJ|nr:putative reverse transcriptase [Oryza sativa Japonica Group]ABF97688.1 retrotransposon protein, putative, unclassified [Oryza sativa Japonica Group]